MSISLACIFALLAGQTAGHQQHASSVHTGLRATQLMRAPGHSSANRTLDLATLFVGKDAHDPKEFAKIFDGLSPACKGRLTAQVDKNNGYGAVAAGRCSWQDKECKTKIELTAPNGETKMSEGASCLPSECVKNPDLQTFTTNHLELMERVFSITGEIETDCTRMGGDLANAGGDKEITVDDDFVKDSVKLPPPITQPPPITKGGSAGQTHAAAALAASLAALALS